MSEKKRKVPKLRFPGFTEDWEQRKLGELFDRYENSVETPHDGYWRLGLRSHCKGTFHTYVEPGSELETADMNMVKAGNFILNITFAWELALAITNSDDEGKLVSHRFPQFKPKENLLINFFKHTLSNNKFKHHLQLASPGGAGRNKVLKVNEMLKFELFFPKMEEQLAITKILDDLDNLITLHQRKLENLKLKKKALLQKLFPKNGEQFPELRFPGFTDAWEQRKLGEILKVNSGKDYKHLEIGDIPVYGTGGYMLSVNEALSEVDAIGIGRKGTIDKPQYLKAPFWTVDTLFYLVPLEEYSCSLLYHLSNLIPWKKFDESTGVPSLSKSTIDGIQVNIPKDKKEQDTISKLFDRINNLITLHQRKLEHLQLQKKALLQQMFV